MRCREPRWRAHGRTERSAAAAHRGARAAPQPRRTGGRPARAAPERTPPRPAPVGSGRSPSYRLLLAAAPGSQGTAPRPAHSPANGAPRSFGCPAAGRCRAGRPPHGTALALPAAASVRDHSRLAPMPPCREQALLWTALSSAPSGSDEVQGYTIIELMSREQFVQFTLEILGFYPSLTGRWK